MHTLKWIIIIFVSVEAGTFIDVNVLEKLDLNVWLSRWIGCLIAVVVALVLDYFLLKKRLTTDMKSRNLTTSSLSRSSFRRKGTNEFLYFTARYRQANGL